MIDPANHFHRLGEIKTALYALRSCFDFIPVDLSDIPYLDQVPNGY